MAKGIMATVPLCLSDGLEAIIKAAKEEGSNVRLVAVTSSSNNYGDTLEGNDGVETKFERLLDLADELSPKQRRLLLLERDNLLYYTPPTWTTHHRCTPTRTEKIPVVPNKDDIYTIIDDSFDLCNTSFCATMALMEQNVPLNRIWFLMPILNNMTPEYPNEEYISFDRARVFFEYIHYDGINRLTSPATAQINIVS